MVIFDITVIRFILYLVAINEEWNGNNKTQR
jgi:hypothetical protein